MEGLKDRNANVIRTHRKQEKPIRVVIPSHASSHARTPPKQPVAVLPEAKSTAKVGLDDEEMLFLARRCLAEELKSRPVIAAALTERNSVFEDTPRRLDMGASSSGVQPIVREPVVIPNRRMFQIQRLGFGLVVLKFGWIWVSCGGLILGDSIFCTSDVFSIIFKRVYKHLFQVGDRLRTATRQTGDLFTN